MTTESHTLLFLIDLIIKKKQMTYCWFVGRTSINVCHIINTYSNYFPHNIFIPNCILGEKSEGEV